jgi:hypothetical protein
MTQKIKSWKEKVSIFFQNHAKKELEEEKQTAKQSIIHLLIKDKTTQETHLNWSCYATPKNMWVA